MAGGLKNTGSIAGRQLVSIDAGRIEHLGDRIGGDRVGLHSAGDIRIEGARLSAVDALSVQAAGAVTVASTVETLQGGGHPYATTQLECVAGLYVTGRDGNGVLSVVAGGDVNLQVTQLRNAGTDGAIQAVAHLWKKASLAESAVRCAFTALQGSLCDAPCVQFCHHRYSIQVDCVSALDARTNGSRAESCRSGFSRDRPCRDILSRLKPLVQDM